MYLTVKEILILSNNIYLFTKKYNHPSQLYFDTKLYSFQGTVSVRSRKISSFNEIYSFREIISIQGNIFI